MNQRGFTDTFDACAKASKDRRLEDEFPHFRDMFDVYHFLLPVGEQINNPDREALAIAIQTNPDLCHAYMSQPKSHLGYNQTNIPRWDMVDSRHIMMSTVL